MDVAFLGRVDDDTRTFEVVSAEDQDLADAMTGVSQPLDETVCALVLDGGIDPVVNDARSDPRLAGVPGVAEHGVRAHVGVPVVADGRVWGTVCAFRRTAGPELDAEHAGTLRFVAGVIGEQLAADADERRAREVARHRVDALIAAGEPTMSGHRIVDLDSGELVGLEALARFRDGPPGDVFALARLAGRTVELELAALRAVTEVIPSIGPEVRWVSCNISPGTAVDERLLPTLDGVDGRRLVIEMTEHEQLRDPAAVDATLAALRLRGTAIAMDDVGAAWSGLERALRIEPEILKLDRALIEGVNDDPRRQALVTAVRAFADGLGATVLAEGIETPAERDLLHALGVDLGQGWLFGHPVPLAELGGTS